MYDNIYGTSCVENHVLAIMQKNGQDIKPLYYDSAVPLWRLYQSFIKEGCRVEYFNSIPKIQDVLKKIEVIKFKLLYADHAEIHSILKNCPDNTYILIKTNPAFAKEMLQIRGWRDDHFVYAGADGNQYEILNDIPLKKLIIGETQFDRLYDQSYLELKFVRLITKEEVELMWKTRTYKAEEYEPFVPQKEDFLNTPDIGYRLRNLVCVYKILRQRFSLYYNDYADAEFLQMNVQAIAKLLAMVEYCKLKMNTDPDDYFQLFCELNAIEDKIMSETKERILYNG